MIKMMTEGKDSLPEMAHVRLSEGLSVIFDQDTLSSSTSLRSRSRSRSSHGSSHSSGSNRRPRAREIYRGRHRSSSTSSSSSHSSRSRPRSRSHPRCHRTSARCRCGSHHRYGHRHRRSPPRHYRAHSRSYSPSSSPDRSSHRRSYRSHSRPRSQRRTQRYVGRDRCRLSRSPSRTIKIYKSQSRSRSSGRSVSLNLDEKRDLLRTAKANATEILGIGQMELPESVKPIMDEQAMESQSATSEPEAWVRPEPVHEKTPSQSSDMDPDEDVPSQKMSPKRKVITFSIHNSVAKPSVAPPTYAKVTPRMDSIESRKPYGHWVPIRRGRTSLSRKHTLATSR
ncbi:arginine/serine-rich protein 1 [Polymixia lowei]